MLLDDVCFPFVFSYFTKEFIRHHSWYSPCFNTVLTRVLEARISGTTQPTVSTMNQELLRHRQQRLKDIWLKCPHIPVSHLWRVLGSEVAAGAELWPPTLEVGCSDLQGLELWKTLEIRSAVVARARPIFPTMGARYYTACGSGSTVLSPLSGQRGPEERPEGAIWAAGVLGAWTRT